MFVADSGSTSHIANIINKMINLKGVKTILKTGNNKSIMGLIRGDWKRYNKICGIFYPVTCIDTAHIPYLSVNIFSTTCSMIRGFNIMSEKTISIKKNVIILIF